MSIFDTSSSALFYLAVIHLQNYQGVMDRVCVSLWIEKDVEVRYVYDKRGAPSSL